MSKFASALFLIGPWLALLLVAWAVLILWGLVSVVGYLIPATKELEP